MTAPMREIDVPDKGSCACPGLQSPAASGARLAHFVPASGWNQPAERIGMQPWSPCDSTVAPARPSARIPARRRWRVRRLRRWEPRFDGQYV